MDCFSRPTNLYDNIATCACTKQKCQRAYIIRAMFAACHVKDVQTSLYDMQGTYTWMMSGQRCWLLGQSSNYISL